jgi:uncharacterized protein
VFSSLAICVAFSRTSYYHAPSLEQGSVVRIATEDIKSAPTELFFTEEMEGLNQLLGQDGETDYRAAAPLHIALTHLRSGGELLFSGAIRGEFTGQCGRCLESYPLALTREFSVVLTPQPPLGRETELSYDELSASFYSGETIDVSTLVFEQTLLALPSAPLCQEDCKGLCPQCGTNRNQNVCDCRSTWRDPRLSILSSLRGTASETGK